MTTQLKLLDYPSDSGQTSGRKDVPGGPHGSVSLTSPSGTPQDITKNAKISVSKTKTVNHTSEVANSSQINESVVKRLKELRRAYDVQRSIAESGNGTEAYNAAILANHLRTEIQKLEKGGIE
jgi:hypothetical protein